jgi:hypothetical protein
VVKQELSVDFENSGRADTVLLYNAPDRSSDIYYLAGLQVLKYSLGSGWALVFEQPGDTLMKGADRLTIEKLRSATGKEGVLVINYHSGAGTVTTWSVLAHVRNRITVLDPAAIRKKLLNAKGYADNGYNNVKGKGDLVTEDLSGYSRHAARCCPNRPNLEMSFKFTGNAIVLSSVKELPYGVPKSGWHGPLLHLNSNGLWAYGYQVADGFLVLGGSETPKDRAALRPPAVATLRNDLVNRGILADAGAYLMLMADYKFPSMSLAAGVMLPGRGNGTLAWRDENGRTAGSITAIKSTR